MFPQSKATWAAGTAKPPSSKRARPGQEQPSSMLAQPEKKIPRRSAVVKIPVRAVVAGEGLVKIVRPAPLGRPVVLLGLVTVSGQISISEPRGDLVGHNRSQRGAAHVPLAAVVVRRPHNRIGRYFGL